MHEVNEGNTSRFGRIMPPFVPNDRVLDSIEKSSTTNGLKSSIGNRNFAPPQPGDKVILNVPNMKGYTKAVAGIKVGSGVGLEVDGVTYRINLLVQAQASFG